MSVRTHTLPFEKAFRRVDQLLLAGAVQVQAQILEIEHYVFVFIFRLRRILF